MWMLRERKERQMDPENVKGEALSHDPKTRHLTRTTYICYLFVLLKLDR